MKCAHPVCGGTVTELDCSNHGPICSECGVPTIHNRPDRKCGQCGARADGKKCADCGSPWVYITYYLDGKWRCRPCCMNIIADNGWNETPEEVRARLKAADEERKRLQKEKEDAEAEAERKAKEERAAKRRKKDQEENLFTSQDAKKGEK